jgi:streptomycin 6-kinase
MLLHGDLHHDNILLAEDGTYKIIDPKGVVGDPVFDVSRFVLNEFDAEPTEPTYRKIVGILHVLSQNLQIPETILKQCLYVETTMGACWCVEDGAAPEEYPQFIKAVTFAETVMNA